VSAPVPPHPLCYEWLADFEHQGPLPTRVTTRWTGTQCLTDTYRYCHYLPLRDSDDALYVDGCELTTTDAAGRVLYRNSWATSHRVTADTVVAIVAAGRSRWKIENELNNHRLKPVGSSNGLKVRLRFPRFFVFQGQGFMRPAFLLVEG
jgi:hypothetical protein